MSPPNAPPGHLTGRRLLALTCCVLAGCALHAAGCRDSRTVARPPTGDTPPDQPQPATAPGAPPTASPTARNTPHNPNTPGSTESPNNTKSSDNTKSTDNTKSSGSTKPSDNTKSSESAKSPASPEPPDNTEPPDPAGGSDTPGTPGATAIHGALSDPNSAPAGEPLAAPGDSASAPRPSSQQADSLPAARFVILADGGPLVIDLVLTVDGAPLSASFAQLVDFAMKLADGDGDGVATWEELATHPRFASGQLGNVAIENDQQRQQVRRMYDSDGDGRVDRDELPRFLTRNGNRSRAFSLRGSNYYRYVNRTSGPTLQRLDTSADGRLDAEELAAAADRLRAADVGEDGILTLAEVDVGDSPAVLTRRLNNDPESAFTLNDQEDFELLEYNLREFYALGSGLRTSHWPRAADLAGALDSDGDEAISSEELQALTNVPAHLRFAVSLGAPRELPAAAAEPGGDAPATAPRPALRLLHTGSDLRATRPEVANYPNRITLRWPQRQLTLFVNDPLSGRQSQLETVFAQLDRDNNGYLESDELPENIPFLGGADFATLDADENGKLYLEELLAYQDENVTAAERQVRGRAGESRDPLFDHLDINADGRLSAREVDRAAPRIKQLDQNEDEVVSAEEIPAGFVVGLVRTGNREMPGGQQPLDALFRMPQGQSQPRSDQPRWFVKMDSNGDGEVTWLEFLGERAQFQQLDANGDGYLDPAEAQTSEPQTSEPQTSEPQTSEPQTHATQTSEPRDASP